MAGSTGVLLAGCGSAAKTVSPADVIAATHGDEADVGILNEVLDLELMSVAAYKAATVHLRGAARASGRRFGEQEAEHAATLSKAIRAAGGKPHAARSSYSFPSFAGQAAALRFAVQFENTAIAAYIDALPKLSNGALRATAASIVTTEAEHLAVLLGALREPQAPSAFVDGAVA